MSIKKWYDVTFKQDVKQLVTVLVEASSEAEAIEKAKAGEGDTFECEDFSVSNCKDYRAKESSGGGR